MDPPSSRSTTPTAMPEGASSRAATPADDVARLRPAARRGATGRTGATIAVLVSIMLHAALVAAILWEWEPESPEEEITMVTLVPVELVVEPPPSPPATLPQDLEGLTLPIVPVLPQINAPLALDGFGAGATGPLDTEAAAGEGQEGTPDASEGEQGDGSSGAPPPTEEAAGDDPSGPPPGETPPGETPPGETVAADGDPAETGGRDAEIEAAAAPAAETGDPQPGDPGRTAAPDVLASPTDAEDEVAAASEAKETETAEPSSGSPSQTLADDPAAPAPSEAAEAGGADSDATEPAEAGAENTTGEDENATAAEDSPSQTPPRDEPVETAAPSGRETGPAPLWGRLGEALRGGSTGPGDGGAEASYAEAVRSAIAPGFYREMALVNASGMVIVEVVIAGDGTIISTRIVQSSGVGELDAGSLAAARAARYPPLPGGRDSLTVHIPLRVR